MKRNRTAKFKLIWKQVFPRDTQLRIERAFEMLLDDELAQSPKSQLGTILDKRSKMADNEIDEKKTKQTTHFERNGREIASLPSDDLQILKGQKTQRK